MHGQADDFVIGKTYTFAWATHGAVRFFLPMEPSAMQLVALILGYGDAQVPTDWYKFNISIVEAN